MSQAAGVSGLKYDRAETTIEAMIATPILSEVAVSDDGQRIAWVSREAHWGEDEYRRNLLVAGSGGGEPLVVGAGKLEARAPAWSAGGELLCLSAAGTGRRRREQVFILRGGRLLQVTGASGGVSYLAPDPAGNGVFYLAPSPSHIQSGERRKRRFGDMEYVGADAPPACLFRVDQDQGIERWEATGHVDGEPAAADPAVQLAGERGHHVVAFDVAADGQRVLYLAAASPHAIDLERASLYLLELPTGEVRQLEAPGPINTWFGVLISPDGRRACYASPVAEGRMFNVCTLVTLDLESGAVERPLASIDSTIIPLRWTERGVAFTWQERTRWYLGLLDDSGRVQRLVSEPDSVTITASISPDGEHVASITAGEGTPFEVLFQGRAVTRQAQLFPAPDALRRELVQWTSSDGTVVEGVLITASEPGGSGPKPLLVVMHGGPTWAALTVPAVESYYPYTEFVRRGFILLDVNYRGSSGYGDEFQKLNYRNLGLGDLDDVTSGVDLLVERGLADAKRVGIMGWSQGGYIAAMCATASTRFAAASVGAGISSWYTYYNNTDIPPFTRHYLGATPWEDPEIYARTSPITYVQQAQTPTLIQHGDRDPRVPTANARELYRGLADAGADVQLVLYRGMGHGAHKPGLMRAIMHQNLAWFCHHLLGAELQPFWLQVPGAEAADAEAGDDPGGDGP